MTPVFLLLIFLSVADVSLSAPAKTQNQPDGSEFILQAPKPNPDLEISIEFGDIVVMNDSLTNASPCTAEDCKWPKSGKYVNVPYFISTEYTQEERKIILGGLKSFNLSTCIRFVPWDSTHRDYIYFEPKARCSSPIGRKDKGQYISLGKKCMRPSTVQHEVIHALGFHHEQSRSDRDQYVLINYENIKPEHVKNFRKVETNNLGTPYDFHSVMHYSKYAFSKNEKPTIVAKADPNYDWGRAKKMSSNDIARINKLYQC
ncbi:low choriolytic enzyme [Austrofundulus limnaeus]|uniref:Metalloendopeptidase n=1 Tax=Austrofundulus limnaeus TaxID=52670 RepID=A0A2I4CA44_AUSLI|nr:PREDICTED: low choriolytic enzyme-like [Austrofundulus limnaeus]